MRRRPSYRIRANESCSTFVRRVIREEVDIVSALLATTARGPIDSRVHQARVHLKKLRAAIELAAAMLKPDDRHREIRATRAAAHALAALRGPTALVEEFDRMVSRFPSALTPGEVTAARRSLRRSGTDFARATVLATARGHVTRMRVRLVDLGVEPDGWRRIESGLIKTYSRARRAYKRAIRGGTRGLHTFRGRAKRHSHHLQLLEPLWPGPLRAQRSEITKLTQDLGHDHDLSLLSVELSSLRISASHAANFDKLITRRRTALQLAALAAGQRLFAETPPAMQRRFAAYFAAFSARP